jgi:hypothetical protein
MDEQMSMIMLQDGGLRTVPEVALIADGLDGSIGMS